MITEEIKLERATLERALRDALNAMQRKNQKHEQHAAPLAVQVSKQLATLIGTEKVAKISSRFGMENFKLVPPIYGPILYPESDLRDLGFRDFLKAFPNIVEVRESFNGDVVIPVGQPLYNREELRKRYLELLIVTIRDLIARTGKQKVPMPTVGLWLNKKDSSFDVAELHCDSLSDWIRSLSEVNLHEDGTVSLSETAPIESKTNREETSLPQRRKAYLIIDSTDIISNLFAVIGNRSADGNLPDWSKILLFCKEHYAEFDWVARYFLAQNQEETISSAGFLNYLKATGIRPHAFDLRSAGKSFDETLEARKTLTKDIMVKTIVHHAQANEAAVIAVCSHDPELYEPLLHFQNTAPATDRVILFGFRERMPCEFHELERHGVKTLDLELDCAAFKEPLKRQSLLRRIEDFDPRETL